MLRSQLIADVEAPHPSYSIRIEPRVSRGAVQPLHTLYEGGCLIMRSRQRELVLAALIRELTVQSLADRGVTLVRCALLVRNSNEAILLSAIMRRQAANNASRLAAQGLEYVATPAVRLDAATAEVLIPGLAFPVSLDAASDLVDIDRLRRALVPRRLNVAAWVLLSEPGSVVAMSRAKALGQAIDAVQAPVPPTTDVFRALAQVLRTATPVAAGDLYTYELIDGLVRVP